MSPLNGCTLEQRVRRALRRGNAERLVKVRHGVRAWTEFGPYYIVDAGNRITSHGHDLESLARELGVLRTDEEVRL